MLARHHRLVLRFSDEHHQPSGLTDPHLHVFTPGGTDIATTNGITYLFTSGKSYPAGDPAAAAAAVRSDQRRLARMARDAALRTWL